MSAAASCIGSILEPHTSGTRQLPLALGCLHSTVLSNAEGAIRFIEDFLPASGSDLPARHSFTIVCRYDDELFQRFAVVLESSAAPTRSVETFKSIPTLEWTFASFTVYRQLVGESHFLIEAGSTKIAVARRDGLARWHAMRIFREIYLREMLLAGQTMLHAAAVALGSNGLLLIGGKGAGKTTVSSRLMSHGWSFVSNDRVFLSWHQGTATAYPYPLDVRAHPASFGPLVADRLAATGLSRGQDEQTGATGSTAASAHKVRLSVREWVHAHGAPSRAGVPISGIVLPQWVGAAGTLQLRRLTPSDAVPRILEHAFLGVGNIFSDEAFGPRRAMAGSLLKGPALSSNWIHKPGPTSIQVQCGAIAACRLLAARLPVYELRIGPGMEYDPLPECLSEIVQAGAVGL